MGVTRRAAVAVAALACCLVGLGVPAGAASTPDQLRHRGAFLTDSHGRVVFLHGINAVFKRPPYVAPDSAAGFTAKDADFLAANGINAVRLGVLFAGVMPKQGVVDQAYLSRIDRVVQLLAARRIWVLLDFHQDAFNETFKGEGFPAWAVHDDGLPFVDGGNFFANYQTPAVQRNYDHFWNGDFGTLTDYTKAWTAVAKKWKTQPYLMGYDLFNEPSAGTQTPTCANPAGCPAFDATMQRAFDQMRKGIRTVDARNMVWYEPQFFFNAISAGNFTHVDDPSVGLSWHDYACTPAFVSGGVIPGNPDCDINEPRVMDNAKAQVATMGAGSLLSEFGAGDDVEDLARMTRFADQHLVGWMYWQYKHYDDPTGSDDEGLFSDDTKPSTLKQAKADVLIHPSPQAIAGTPTALSWNPATRTMSVTYTPDPRTGLTDVFVPARTYAHGKYDVEVIDAKVTRVQGQHVLVRADGPAPVTVIVRPHDASKVPTFNIVVVDGPGRAHGPGLASTGLPVTLPAAGLALMLLLSRRRA